LNQPALRAEGMDDFIPCLAGVFWCRRACPPTVWAATVISERHDELALGEIPGSRCRPSTRRRAFQARLSEPKPGQCGHANQQDD